MTAETFLATVPLLAELPADHLASIAAAGRTKNVGPGETVFREGDVSDGLYVVLAGKVRIYKQNDDGNEVELATGAAGEYFGELALIDGGTRSASVASPRRASSSFWSAKLFWHCSRNRRSSWERRWRT